MDEHPLTRLVDRLVEATELSQAEALALLRQAWDAGVEEGTRRMVADLAAAHRELGELRRQLDGG